MAGTFPIFGHGLMKFIHILLIPTSAFTFAPLVARNGGTPCWAVHYVFGCSALAHCSQCDSVDAFLCIVDVEGPLHVRQPVILMPNSFIGPSQTCKAEVVDSEINEVFWACQRGGGISALGSGPWGCNMSTGGDPAISRAGLGVLSCAYWPICARCKHQLKEGRHGSGKGGFIS